MLKKSLKLFSAVVFAAVTVVCLSSSVESGEGSGYSCTVTTNCYNHSGQVGGSVSCTGTRECKRGSSFVQCDGIPTYCY